MWKKKLPFLSLPFLLLFFLMLEGVLAVYFIGQLISPTFQMAIQLFSTVVFLIAAYLSEYSLLGLILVIGVVYDAYYSPVLSFYTISLIIVYTLVRKIAPKFKATFLRNIWLLGSANMLYNIIVYVEAIFLKLNRVDFISYLQQKVFPSLFFNLVLMFIIYIPVVKLLKWIDRTAKTKVD